MSDIVNALPQGTIIRGAKNVYQIQRVLGQGSFGITYLATMDMQVSGPMGSFTAKVQVAVKEFFMKDLNGRSGSEVTGSSQGGYFVDYKRKFLREAMNLAKLQHPHIVKVLESFEANGTAYYAMEYLDEGSLDDYIQRRGALKEDEALPIIRQVGSALEEMHAHRMLHLDLKPGNIMLRKTGEAVLIDFGLSKQFDKNGEPESSTSIGCGTPGYAPLEQANYQRGDGLPVTMDVYALGATLYKMLTGERPPEASGVLNDGLPLSVLKLKNVSAQTMTVIEKAMSPMHKHRYQNVRAFMDSLAVVSTSPSEEPTVIIAESPASGSAASSSSEPTRPLPKPINWKRTAYIFSGCVGLVLALVLFIKILNSGHDTSNPVIVDPPVVADTTSSSSLTFSLNGIRFKMIRVDGGTFTMGATSEQGSDTYDDETPTHQVTLSSYYIAETEVTQELWQAVMGTTVILQRDLANKDWPLRGVGSTYPMYYISWEECRTFILKLNSLTGKTFRLPTEAEWEYAARGGNKSQGYKYSGSNTLGNVAWYDANSDKETHSVKTKSPNELGIYDMSGNVWEWCQDWYGSYSSSSQTNPTGPASGSYRVIRGGSWDRSARGCRVSLRYYYTPDDRFSDLGLRLVL